MSKRRIIAATLPLVVLGGVWAWAGNRNAPTAAAKQEAQQPKIPAPDVWVPFTADLRQTKENGPPVVGRYYRSSNGSERTESGPTENPTFVVDIKNIPRGLYFTKARDKATGREYWVQRPLALPAGGYRPPQMREGTGMDRRLLKEPYDNREVVSVLTGPGMMNLMAPSLNFYPVVKMYATTGTRIAATVTSTEEPEVTLFEPPAGAEIRRSDKPGGIVFDTPAEAAARGEKIAKPDQR